MVGGVRKACQTCMYMYVGNVTCKYGWCQKSICQTCMYMYVGDVWRWCHSQDAAAAAAAAAAAFFIPPTTDFQIVAGSQC